MIITHELKMDLARRGATPRIDVVQDDRYSRDLAILMYSGGKPWTPGAGVSVVVRYVRKDHSGGAYDMLPDGTPAGQIRGNVATVALAPQVCTAAGRVNLTVCLVKDDAQLHSFVIELDVQDNPGLSTSSADYYKLSGTVPNTGWEPGKYLGTDESGNVVSVDVPVYDTVEVDATLTREGQAADAKAVGDRLAGTVQSINGVAPDPGGNISISFTGLPLPATANVGQFFRVKSVDASGRVTAVEAVNINAGALLAYAFNGVNLTTMPEWDAEKYPYVFLCVQDSYMGYCRAYLFVVPTVDYTVGVGSDGGEYRAIRTENGLAFDATFYPDRITDTVWSSGTTGEYTGIDGITWANFDVLNEDGSVYLAASEPVPVYEGDGTDSGGMETVELTTVVPMAESAADKDLTEEEGKLLEAAVVKGAPFIVRFPLMAESIKAAGVFNPANSPDALMASSVVGFTMVIFSYAADDESWTVTTMRLM